MSNHVSRRKFLGAAAASVPGAWSLANALPSHRSGFDQAGRAVSKNRIIDMHVHFDEKRANFIADFLRLSERLNLTACLLTPFANRKVVADAAKQYPTQIIPFAFVDLDAPDVVKQVEELHAMGFRGLGELEFVKKPYNDPSYFPVYELANRYGWIVMFHTGIVLRRNFDEPEDVASGRMRPIYLEEIARRFPKITILGAHCGNPEYEWAAEIANETMHGVLHLAWVPDNAGGYRGQLAVYVKPNGLLGTAYMAAIRPFRHLIVYPRMIREIGRAWRAEADEPAPTHAT